MDTDMIIRSPSSLAHTDGNNNSMDIITMMQMDHVKLPDFFSDPPPPPAAPIFHNQPETLPFMGNSIHHQNPMTSPFPYNNYISSFEKKTNSMAAMREMIFRIAAMQPIHIDPESVKPPKRKNVRISKDPQSVAARHRREKISERIRILQRLVPGGTKMDTASMLDEAIHYVKFLKKQVQNLEQAGQTPPPPFGFSGGGPGINVAADVVGYHSCLVKGASYQTVLGNMQMLI